MIFFTRGTKITYWLARLACRFCKSVFFVVVQKPEEGFLQRVKRHPLKCSYLYLDDSDVETLSIRKGYKKKKILVGIDSIKFSPVAVSDTDALKRSYGFTSGKPLVVHVGHLSAGRGLEDFLSIDGDRYDRLIVDSGMFEAKELKDKLITDGVRVVSGYIENIESIYRMADVYFFPTKDGSYVISVPLSVMESLSCGTPVVAYASFKKLTSIEINNMNAVTLIDDKSGLAGAIAVAEGMKRETSYLSSAKSWNEAATDVFKWIKDECTK